jgi:hypothetical protein
MGDLTERSEAMNLTKKLAPCTHEPHAPPILRLSSRSGHA